MPKESGNWVNQVQGIETEQDLYDYIKNRKYYCIFCSRLQKRVIDYGVDEIAKYDDMICGGVEDMMIRYSYLKDKM